MRWEMFNKQVRESKWVNEYYLYVTRDIKPSEEQTITGNSTTADEVYRFQHLFLVGWHEEGHQKLAPIFPWIDNCLMVTKWDFLEMEALL